MISLEELERRIDLPLRKRPSPGRRLSSVVRNSPATYFPSDCLATAKTLRRCSGRSVLLRERSPCPHVRKNLAARSMSLLIWLNRPTTSFQSGSTNMSSTSRRSRKQVEGGTSAPVADSRIRLSCAAAEWIDCEESPDIKSAVGRYSQTRAKPLMTFPVES
jgi:hypothetical protein